MDYQKHNFNIKIKQFLLLDSDIPDDPVGHGGSWFLLVGPVLRFTLEQNPMFLYWAQTPPAALSRAAPLQETDPLDD